MLMYRLGFYSTTNSFVSKVKDLAFKFASIVSGRRRLALANIAGILILTFSVTTFAQTPVGAAPGQPEIHWQLVFSGSRRIGAPESGSAIISEAGLSDIHDLTFT